MSARMNLLSLTGPRLRIERILCVFVHYQHHTKKEKQTNKQISFRVSAKTNLSMDFLVKENVQNVAKSVICLVETGNEKNSKYLEA